MTLTHNVTLDWADAATDLPPVHGGLTRVRRGSRARDEPARHAGRPVARLRRDHGRRAAGGAGAGDLLALVRAALCATSRATCRTRSCAAAAKRRRGDGHLRGGFIDQDAAAGGTARRSRNSRPRRGPRRWLSATKYPQRLMGNVKVPATTDRQGGRPHRAHAQGGGHRPRRHRRRLRWQHQWPEGLADVSKYPFLFAELIRRGWSDDDLKLLAGENLLRAFGKAEARVALDVDARVIRHRPR